MDSKKYRNTPSLGTAIMVITAVAIAKFVSLELASGAFISASAFSSVALVIASAVAVGCCLALSTFVMTYCLKIMGSLRTFAFDYADIALVAAIGLFSSSSNNSTRSNVVTRGLLLVAIGALLMLWYTPSATTVVVTAEGTAPVAAEIQPLYRLLLSEDDDVRSLPSVAPPSEFESGGLDKPNTQRVSRRGAAAFAAARRVKTALDAQTMSSVVLAACFVMLAAWMNNVRRRLTQTVADDAAVGLRRIHGIVLIIGAAASLPMSILNSMFSSPPPADAEVPSFWSFLTGASMFGLVVLFLAEALLGWSLPSSASSTLFSPSVASKRPPPVISDTLFIRLLLLLAGFTCGVVFCAFSSSASLQRQLTYSSMVGFFGLFFPGTVMTIGLNFVSFMDNLSKRFEGRAGPDSSKLALLSRAASLLSSCFRDDPNAAPLPTHNEALTRSSSDDTHAHADLSFGRLTRRVMKHVWEDKNSRKIFLFLCINFSFMFVEIIVGWLTNSLGLISDAGHMFFDNASLFIGLYASYMARWKADELYTYGYARYEVLAGFVNAIFLIFVALSVVFEALERLWEPPEIHGEHVLPVSVLGLAVNIVGLVFFHDFAHGHGDHGHSHGPAASSSHGHSHGGDSHGHAHSGGTCPSEAKSDHGHAHGAVLSDVDRAAQDSHNENMQGVFLHVLADALGSVGVICSSLLIKYFGWNLADPIASLFISILILLSVIPLIKATASPLLSRVPLALESGFRNAVLQANRLGDVVAVEQPHIWKQHADVIVATMHVRVRADADEQKVLRQAKKLLTSAGANVVTVQIEKEGHHAVSAPQTAQNIQDAVAVTMSNGSS